jgi:hypothetical protein
VSKAVLNEDDLNRDVRVLIDKQFIVTQQTSYDKNVKSVLASDYTNGHVNSMPGFAVEDVFMDEYEQVLMIVQDRELDRRGCANSFMADLIMAVEHLSDVFCDNLDVLVMKWYVLERMNPRFVLKVRYPGMIEHKVRITRDDYIAIRDALRAFWRGDSYEGLKFAKPDADLIAIEHRRLMKKSLASKMSTLIGLMNDEYDKIMKLADSYECFVLDDFKKIEGDLK